MAAKEPGPNFFCNKCLHHMRLFDANIPSVSSTGKSSSPINSLTSCYHILCNACRPRITRDSPAVCPVCLKKCLLLEIGTKTMPLQKQLLFYPLSKSIEMVNTVIKFQENQQNISGHKMAKQHAHIKQKVLDQKRDKQLIHRQQYEQLKGENNRLRAAYRFYQEQKSLVQAERERRHQATQAKRRRRSTDNRYPQYEPNHKPANYHGGRRLSIDNKHTYNCPPQPVAATVRQQQPQQPQRRSSRQRKDEHRFQLDLPPAQPSQRRISRDRRPSMHFEEPPAQKQPHRYSNEKEKHVYQAVTPGRIGHRRYEMQVDSPHQKPAAAVAGQRRYDIVFPDNMVIFQGESMPKGASDSPSAYRPTAHRRRFESPPY